MEGPIRATNSDHTPCIRIFQNFPNNSRIFCIFQVIEDFKTRTTRTQKEEHQSKEERNHEQETEKDQQVCDFNLVRVSERMLYFSGKKSGLLVRLVRLGRISVR